MGPSTNTQKIKLIISQTMGPWIDKEEKEREEE